MVHRSDDDDTEDLYDDEFDFVDEDDDLEDEVDDAEEDVADEGDAVGDASDLDESLREEEKRPKGRGRGRKPAPPRKAPAPPRSLFDESADEPAAARSSREMAREEPLNGETAERDPDRRFDVEEVEEESAAAGDYDRPAPLANYRVHVYEFKHFKRTIDRPFTPEDAEAFASEYNRTSKSYGRFAVTGKEDVHPRKLLD